MPNLVVAEDGGAVAERRGVSDPSGTVEALRSVFRDALEVATAAAISAPDPASQRAWLEEALRCLRELRHLEAA